MKHQIRRLASLLIVPSLYLLLASAETVTQCSSADNRTCEQECPWGEPLCNLSCQAAPKFDACAQECSARVCDDLHCQEAHNCTQDCGEGQCGQLNCDNIFNSCEQNCGKGNCSEAICTNSRSCRQQCNGGKCDQLICTNATECGQNCSSGLCEELNCGAGVKSCRQDGHQGNLTCVGESCDQLCKDGSCSVSCSGAACNQRCLGGGSCQMTCNASTCEQWCEGNTQCNLTCSAGVESCNQTCSAVRGTCYFHSPHNHTRRCLSMVECYHCWDDVCELFSGAVWAAAVPGFSLLAGVLLFSLGAHHSYLY